MYLSVSSSFGGILCLSPLKCLRAVGYTLPLYKSVFEERFYLWPIPQSEIDKNNGGLIQNPDYK